MATITTVQAGNWSATTTWVGGVVPGVGDDAVISHSVAADVDIVCDAILGVGPLNVTTSRNITVSGIIGHQSGAHTTLLVNMGNVNDIANISFGQLRTQSSTNNDCRAIVIQGNGTVNLNGDMIPAGGNGRNRNVSVLSGVKVFVNGSLLVGGSSGTFNGGCIYIDNASAEVYITGTIDSGGTSPIVVLNGKLFLSAAIVAASSSRNAVYATGGEVFYGSVTMFSGLNGRAPVWSPFIKQLTNSSVQITMKTDDVNTDRLLYTANQLTGYPTEADVRSGEQYGPVGEFTGTLDPVNVDTNAIAAAITTSLEISLPPVLSQPLAQDLFSEITVSTDPLANRLRNVATTSTVNAAIGSISVIP
jgi:hypothetical protein